MAASKQQQRQVLSKPKRPTNDGPKSPATPSKKTPKKGGTKNQDRKKLSPSPSSKKGEAKTATSPNKKTASGPPKRPRHSDRCVQHQNQALRSSYTGQNYEKEGVKNVTEITQEAYHQPLLSLTRRDGRRPKAAITATQTLQSPRQQRMQLKQHRRKQLLRSTSEPTLGDTNVSEELFLEHGDQDLYGNNPMVSPRHEDGDGGNSFSTTLSTPTAFTPSHNALLSPFQSRRSSWGSNADSDFETSGWDKARYSDVSRASATIRELLDDGFLDNCDDDDESTVTTSNTEEEQEDGIEGPPSLHRTQLPTSLTKGPPAASQEQQPRQTRSDGETAQRDQSPKKKDRSGSKKRPKKSKRTPSKKQQKQKKSLNHLEHQATTTATTSSKRCKSPKKQSSRRAPLKENGKAKQPESGMSFDGEFQE
mmetsp:Transcript_21492/g.59619  ORF Transcript_21492/g.59619 Transcript_21492/m.59619 type:complete len:421 (+) Transcript_21492:129-1391(+)